MGRVLNQCPAHASVPDGALYAAMMREGHQLCGVLRLLLGEEDEASITAVVTQITEAKTHPNGSSAGRGFKTGIEYRWQFSGTGESRVFQFEVVGANLKVQEKAAVRAALSSRFGAMVELL
jgi:hypothetical protein